MKRSDMYYEVFEKIYSDYLSGDISIETAIEANDLAYDKYCEDSDFYESVRGKIGKVVRDIPTKINLVKKLGFTQKEPKVINKDDITDKEYEELNSLINNMLKTDNYSIYKSYFNKFSNKLGIKPSVIIEYKLKKGDKDKNSIYIRYEEKNKSIRIPNGYSLYHMSPCNAIKELEPKFKGKSPRNYLYSTPRIYCSINPTMHKGYAQFKGNKKSTKVTKYKIDESINSAFIDDRIGNVMSGALYIETLFPIKVEKID